MRPAIEVGQEWVAMQTRDQGMLDWEWTWRVMLGFRFARKRWWLCMRTDERGRFLDTTGPFEETATWFDGRGHAAEESALDWRFVRLVAAP